MEMDKRNLPLLPIKDFFCTLNKFNRVKSGPLHFADAYDFIQGQSESKVSLGHMWSKRSFCSDYPYNVDLVVGVFWLPNGKKALSCFRDEADRDLQIYKAAASVDKLDFEVKADDFYILRIEAFGPGPTYCFTSVYSNYVFKVSAQISEEGYFRSYADIAAALSDLDKHISVTLNAVLMAD